MNPKQTAPLLLTLPVLAAAAPPVIIGSLIGGAILLLLKALLSDDKPKQPEAPSVEASTESRKPAETTVFRRIPAAIPAAKLASVPRAVITTPAVQLVPKASLPVPAPQKIVVPFPPPPIKNKFIRREDMARAFHHGARTLTRTNAVAALKSLGFGRTAAYAALTPDGRFSAWLHFAPDGIITWTECNGFRPFPAAFILCT